MCQIMRQRLKCCIGQQAGIEAITMRKGSLIDFDVKVKLLPDVN